jgi:hypothetical protein
MAAGAAKTSAAPAIKSVQVKQKAVQAKPSVLNANAKMGRHHHKHFRHHQRSHKRVGAANAHQLSKVTIKHAAPAAKRG